MSLSKILLKWSVVIISIAVIFFYLIFSFSSRSSSQEIISFSKQENSNQEKIELPIHIKIPRLNIDTTIEHVGLTSDGAMDVPKEPENVAWFNLGVTPGEIGSAVIDGHSGYKDNRPAIFDNLHKLRKGDKIYIEDLSGNTIVFIVRENRKYNRNADAASVFSSNDGKSHLNLITCIGDWDERDKTHSERLVVFADKE